MDKNLATQRLVDQFVEMARIASPSRKEAQFAAYMKKELEALGFEVAADAPAALLHDFVWPVVATFERAGRSHEVVLEVSEGRLWRLSQFVDDEDLDPETVDWSWPSADQLSVTPGSRTWE